MSRWSDIAEWRGPTVNVGGPMVEQRGLVIHIAEGTYEGTIAWQKNPAAQVSSHFVVGKDGHIAQVVDTATTAWTQRLGNGHWLSVENEGYSTGPLTPAQVEANARLFAYGHKALGWPLQLATSPSGRGLGHHSMGAESGVDWGHSECPGAAIKAQKPAILARAIQIVNGSSTVEEEDMTPEEHALLSAMAWRVDALQAGSETVRGGDRKGETMWAVEKLGAPAPVEADVVTLASAFKLALQDPTMLAALAKAVNDDAAARLAE
jgi:hypothetical protein